MEEIKSILEAAINKFNENDEYLIKNDLSERCICSRLAFYLQQILMTSIYNEYIVDVEYNRGAKGKDNHYYCVWQNAQPKFFARSPSFEVARSHKKQFECLKSSHIKFVDKTIRLYTV